MGGVVETITDDWLGFDPGGGGIYDVARDVLGDTIADDVLGLDPGGGGMVGAINTAAQVAVGVAAAYAIPALAGEVAAATATGASAVTAEAALAAQSAELLAAGFEAADVAVSLAGLGDAAQISSILTSAGVDATTAASLGSEVITNDAALNSFTKAVDTGQLTSVESVAQPTAELKPGVTPDAVHRGLPADPGPWAGDINLGQGHIQPLSPAADPIYGRGGISLEAQPTITGSPIGNTLAETITADAQQLAASGLDANTIQQVLVESHGIDPLSAANISQAAQSGHAYTSLADIVSANLPTTAGIPLPPGEFVLPNVEAGSLHNPDILNYLNTNVPIDVPYDPYLGNALDYLNTGANPFTDIPYDTANLADIGEPFINSNPLDYLNNNPLTYDLTAPAATSLSQADMLAKQYEGFNQADIVKHMAGSAIDPIMAEEILGSLGMDQFAVSDYMAKNPTSFGNTYADPSFFDKLKSFAKTANTFKSVLGDLGVGGGGGTTGSANVNQNYSQLMSQLDPYWNYRLNTEIPMMGAAAGAAGKLSGLYQQSYTDPLSIYQTPEMQATNAAFMNEMQRKDAAAGRMSQAGARGVEAQNNFLTKTLPTYRTNLQQGLGTLYHAARPQAISPETTANAMTNASLLSAANQANQQGTITGALSNLQGSWNQMTGSNNVFDQVTGAVNTASNMVDLYDKGTQAWNKLSNLF